MPDNNVFPASFTCFPKWIPLPCGYYGDPVRECRCSPRQIENYRQRISGPLLERIDIHVEVALVEFDEHSHNDHRAEDSATIRQRVKAARKIQQQRFHRTKNTTNAAMSAPQQKQCCQLDDTSRGYLVHAMQELHLSARAHDRILKVARTLANLGGSKSSRPNDILEAIQFRSLDRKLFA